MTRSVRRYKKTWLLPENHVIDMADERTELSDMDIGIDEEREFYDEVCSSESEDNGTGDRFPIHHHNDNDALDPKFEVGMIFKSKDELRAAIVNYGVRIGRPLYFKKNDNVRVRAQCKGTSCTFCDIRPCTLGQN